MAFGISKGMLIPLMVLNFCLYFIAAALAGSVLNRNLDADAGFGGTNSPIGEYQITIANSSITMYYLKSLDYECFYQL